MARRKNVKRIDPRYFLHETVLREGDDIAPEEVIQAAEQLEGNPEVEQAIQAALQDPKIMAAVEALRAGAQEEALEEARSAADIRGGSREDIRAAQAASDQAAYDAEEAQREKKYAGWEKEHGAQKLATAGEATALGGAMVGGVATFLTGLAAASPSSIAGAALASIGGFPVFAAMGLSTIGVMGLGVLLTQRASRQHAQGREEQGLAPTTPHWDRDSS